MRHAASTRCGSAGWLLAWALGLAWIPLVASAGSFSSAGEGLGVDVVKHPLGYDGTGGDLTLTVCLDPSDPESADAATSVFFAVRTWNQRIPSLGNTVSTGEFPMTQMDFESTALRALGLCLGLDDPSDAAGFTRATDGLDDVFTLGAGADLVAGTRDDLRGDDQNLMWFRIFDNDPFTSDEAVVDSSTFARDTAVLPEGDAFAATSTREVADAAGLMATEAVMVDGLLPGETKRQLTWDDIATLRYAESGLDETDGTADDYRVRLDYVGLAADCDLQVSFDTQSELAACVGGTQLIQDNHFRFGFSNLVFSDAVQWYFSNLELLFFDGFESGDLSGWD